MELQEKTGSRHPRAVFLAAVAALGALMLLRLPPQARAQDAPRKLLVMASYADVSASSSREDPNGPQLRFAPVNVLDNEPRTAWCAGRQMLGVGEWVEIGLLVPMELRRIGLVGTVPPPSGEPPPENTPLPYNRIKSITVRTPLGEERTIEFSDSAAMQYRNIKPISGQRFRFRVESVFAGKDRPLTCISEIELFGTSRGEGAALDAEGRAAMQGDIASLFDQASAGAGASLAAAPLQKGFSRFFARYSNYTPIGVTKEVADFSLPARLIGEKPAANPEHSPCAVAIRALYEANPFAERYLRERYFFDKAPALAHSCGENVHALFFALSDRKESIPLFWARREYYGLLELRDARALEPFLAAYRDRAVYRWWEKPSGWHKSDDRSPVELVARLTGAYPKSVLRRMIEKSEAGYFRDGLQALLRRLEG